MSRALATLVALHLGACATETEPPSYGEGLGTHENPIPRDDVWYAVGSQVGTDGVPIPAAVTAATAHLRAFSAKPADTLLAIASSASSVDLAKLYAELPLTLTSRLRGWIDIEIDKVKVAAVPMRTYASEVAGFAETALTRYTVDSELSFTPLQTDHSLRALRFRLAGLDVVVPIGGLKADAIGQTPAVAVAELGVVTFGDHSFGLAFGSHAWHAVNLASTQQYQADVVTALTHSINCQLLGQTVAARCYSGVCVGHQAQLTAVCEKSLQQLASELSTNVTAQSYDELHIVSGTARLLDSTNDGLAERIEGTWDVEIPASSTVKFTAEAIR
jgi:hypothetical protein